MDETFTGIIIPLAGVSLPAYLTGNNSYGRLTVRITRYTRRNGVIAIGVCNRKYPFRGSVTVSDKGQIVIPAALMRELEIEKGAQLFIIKREDNLGFVAIKSEAVSDMIMKLVGNNPV